jgi:hypothetical protein
MRRDPQSIDDQVGGGLAAEFGGLTVRMEERSRRPWQHAPEKQRTGCPGVFVADESGYIRLNRGRYAECRSEKHGGESLRRHFFKGRHRTCTSSRGGP